MNQKHVIEIPENVVTAFVTMRQEDGAILSGVAKGEPHYTESLAIAFGTFVSMVVAVEQMGGTEVEVAKTIREYIRENDLEKARQLLGRTAAITRAVIDLENGGDE